MEGPSGTYVEKKKTNKKQNKPFSFALALPSLIITEGPRRLCDHEGIPRDPTGQTKGK